MRLTRFLFSYSQFSKQNKRVKYNAFIPYKNEVSVYKTGKIDDKEIWEIGNKFVAAIRKKEIKARGDLKEKIVAEQDLK